MNFQIIYNHIYDYHSRYSELPELSAKAVTFTKQFKGLTFFLLPEEAMEKIRQHCLEKYGAQKVTDAWK